MPWYMSRMLYAMVLVGFVAVRIVLGRAGLWNADGAWKMLLLPSLGPAILGAGAMVLANGALDPQELEQHTVAIVDKHVSGAGSDRSLHLEVEDWRDGRTGQTLKFQFYEPDVFERLKKGDSAVLVAGPGLFGWWLRELVPIVRAPAR